jgi:hypothetical protein
MKWSNLTAVQVCKKAGTKRKKEEKRQRRAVPVSKTLELAAGAH